MRVDVATLQDDIDDEARACEWTDEERRMWVAWITTPEGFDEVGQYFYGAAWTDYVE